MNTLATLAIASGLFLSACAGPSPRTEDGQANAVHYRCDSGARITARYPATDSAEIRYQGESHVMRIAVSGSGARYLGGGWVWWTKGSGPGSQGTLFRQRPDAASTEIIERCTELPHQPALAWAGRGGDPESDTRDEQPRVWLKAEYGF
ncbi:MliC family protein [Alkalilimnicola sp. S0819]|uniref:MliC family protein n=1 Tax=Alkalilimnicola sp. S0819 TaxID=2613922 RepID=UPI00186A3B78|nr:MliC family protein [Alkalilimnicola sp. S0819]